MAILALALAVLAILVWAGRRPVRLANPHRLARALFSALAAAGAVAAGLRGEWLVTLGLVGVSAWLIGGVRKAGAAPRPPGGAMSLEEARSTLGVRPGATPAEIDGAYRRLILRAHPDRGGSSGLAAQLNAARDRLMK